MTYIPTKAPDSVRVGYRDFPMRPMTELEHRIGNCSGYFTPRFGILYLDSWPSPQETVNGVIHETLHAIWNVHGLGGEDALEEQTVNSLANGLTQVIRDNPELVYWMVEQLAKEPRPVDKKDVVAELKNARQKRSVKSE